MLLGDRLEHEGNFTHPLKTTFTAAGKKKVRKKVISQGKKISFFYLLQRQSICSLISRRSSVSSVFPRSDVKKICLIQKNLNKSGNVL